MCISMINALHISSLLSYLKPDISVSLYFCILLSYHLHKSQTNPESNQISLHKLDFFTSIYNFTKKIGFDQPNDGQDTFDVHDHFDQGFH